MVIARDYESFKKAKEALRGSIGFVPTMGALHKGHISLIKRAVSENDNVVVSIFVNPTQFLEGEDLDKYPRKEEADIKICELAGVDILFMPTIDSIYFKDELKIDAPAIAGYILEGAIRPGHFGGVLQVVMKLFNIVSPTRAYFGKKDAQQLLLIEKMVREYFLDIDIIECDIVRDDDGLALSSRNVYLSPSQRDRALAISRALKRAGKMIMAGERSVDKIKKQMQIILKEVDKVEYIEVVDRNLNRLDEIVDGKSIILVAARVGTTRLIDNLWV